jgi:hypothetical protein
MEKGRNMMAMIERFLGHRLRGIRTGEVGLLSRQPDFFEVPLSIILKSQSFESGGEIPLKFSSEGENIIPDLEWSCLPAGTEELVLVVEDIDVPLPKPFVHSIIYGIPPAVGEIKEGWHPQANSSDRISGAMLYGKNTSGSDSYRGPRPILGHGKHRYVFQIFALDKKFQWPKPPAKKDLAAKLRGHVLARGELVGTYERK